MVGHALIILRIDVAHVNQRVAQLILSTIGVCTDNVIDGLVTHRMDVHGDALCVCLARDVSQFLFGPVGETLMPVGIERLHIAGAAFHRAVHEKLEPVCLDTGAGIFLNLS